MAKRWMLTGILGAVVLGLALGAAGEARSLAEVIRIGTLAPKASTWGRALDTWAKAVVAKSDGRLELQLWYNGQQGDEGAMVGKIKAGHLDGAAITAVGLSKIYKPIVALQMPGLFRKWDELDRARIAFSGEFGKGASDAGFTILDWCDVGAVRLMSKGFAVRTPDDIKGKKPYLWRDSVIAPVLYQVVGGVTPVPLNVPEVLPSLNTGAINIVAAPPLAAEQLQWSSKLDTITTAVSSYSIGAVVVSSKRLAALPDDLRTILTETAAAAAAELRNSVRAEDDAAFVRLQGKMTVITLSADERSKFDALFKQVRRHLADGTFAAELVAKLEAFGK
jgi:TRAP-type C4-dicarboxylate transport system substrate-binding protein